MNGGGEDEVPPIRLVTRLLSEMQTSIVAAGIRAFDGDLDRFVIFTLIVRQGMRSWEAAPGEEDAGAISTHSLAASLSRPFETVRRHVIALTEAGLCARTPSGVRARRQAQARPEIREAMIVAHDSLVRLVEDLARFGVPLPPARAGVAYDPAAGLQASADVMLAVIDSNMPAHSEWLNLVLFSSILCANSRAITQDPALAQTHRDHRNPVPGALWRPVRISVLSRTIGIPESTLRRHAAELMRRGSVMRARGGLVVNEAWLNTPPAVAISTASYHNIRRILTWLGARGFALDAPAGAYLRGRPDDAPFA
ncbi:hypothetical protein ACFQ1E_17060 [Sphingomonas canadensis]|uniref:Uncharacterized protein n=1 Tax=Sphingomonas canadensis TaxID=1219257 RepID=A0ABW3H993_9SPHN|nr:hypothetical protein [Sphingomonas canadensis]MCW3837757.1 hypothetical protein [Sphingomonas canadensis]